MDRWRVDIHEESDYANDKLFVSKGGSCVAVEPDGNIISVCHNTGDPVRGRHLLEFAVQNGGDRLDAFSFLYDFYTRNGFIPVSWVSFNKDYAPDGWDETRDNEEPVIFFKYSGKQERVEKRPLEDFLSETKESKDYDNAKSLRDMEIKR